MSTFSSYWGRASGRSFDQHGLMGQIFFYVDEETGIGWNSVIEEVSQNYDTASLRLYLSCGTQVNVAYKDYAMGDRRALFTNLKEENV